MSNAGNASPQPSAAPVQQSPIQPPPVNKVLSKPHLFVGLLIFIIISAIAEGAYLLGMQKTSLLQQQSEQNNNTYVEGWKTYTSPSGDFTIQYPSNWEYLELNESAVGFGYFSKDYKDNQEAFLVIDTLSTSEEEVY
jgi:hypothetical protein